MTTASFTKFVRTMEGQYQVSLGHTLAKESSEDNVSRMLPLKDPIIILNREKKKTNHYNPNMKNKTLSLICNYVRCHPIGTHCSSTIRPLGHCCDVCGGVMSFSSNTFTAEDIADLIQEIIKEDNLLDLVQYSIDRIDDNDIIPRYQVTVLPVKKYDDIVFRVLIMELHNKLSGRKRTMMDYFSVEYEWSALDHSYAQTSKIAGLVTFCILVLAVAAVFWRNNMETDGFTLRGFLFANASSPFRVVWHQGKEDDEDVVQLVNSGEDITPEEEDAYIPSLEVLTPVPMVFQHQAVPLPNKNVSEGLSVIELEMIE
ncbi:hypothetical protein RB195_013969 [Necator americanus]